MTQQGFRTAAATAAVRRKRQERLARDLISWGWKVYAPEDHETPWATPTAASEHITITAERLNAWITEQRMKNDGRA
jgi:hypothetical protein